MIILYALIAHQLYTYSTYNAIDNAIVFLLGILLLEVANVGRADNRFPTERA